MALLEHLPPGIEISWLYSQDEYLNWERDSDFSGRRTKEEQICNLLRSSRRPFLFLSGMCVFCKRESNFLLDSRYGQGQRDSLDFQPNWRERLICTRCNLSNRARFIYFILESIPKNSKIWITEQDTSLFRAIKLKYPNLIGSEYLSIDGISGTIDERGIRHEDINQSSFKGESLETVICLDVLEHVPNVSSAIKELHRVLKNQGVCIATFPFERQSDKTIERAIKNQDGSITYFAPPEYHGNPLLKEEILCYRHFGWDVVEKFKEAGFQSARVGLGWSEHFVNLGPEQIVLVAVK